MNLPAEVVECLQADVLIVDEKGEVVFCNSHSVRSFGLGEPPTGRHLAAMGRDGKRLLRVLEEAPGREVLVELSDGTVKSVCHWMMSLDERPLRCMLARDVARTSAEVDRRVQAKLVASAAKTAKFMRHEMKNPLAGILAGLQVLAGETELSDDAQRVVELLIDEVKSAATMLDQAVDSVKIEISDPKPHSVEDLVKRVAQDTTARWSARGTTVELIGGRPNATVTADEGSMFRALQNLITNALEEHAGPEGIEIGWRDVEEQEREALFPGFGGNVISIFVRAGARDLLHDSLPPPPSRPIPRIKPRKPGWGLAVAEQIVDIHGGILTLGSRPSGGTSLEVYLPGESSGLWDELPECECLLRPGDSRDRLTVELEVSDEPRNCWFARGLAVRLEEGVWPEVCRRCPVFRAYNLSAHFLGGATVG